MGKSCAVRLSLCSRYPIERLKRRTFEQRHTLSHNITQLTLKMKNLLISCVLVGAFIINSCNGQRTPSISYISQEQIKDIGGTVELDCSVQYAREYTVVWIKTGRNHADYVFLSTGSSLVIKDSRFALRFDGASSTFTLQIKDIQETDAGVYQCEVVLSVNNKITAEVELSVRRPPIISDNSTQSIVASEGQSVQMECYAAGYPTPTIIWRRENNALLPTGKVISINESWIIAI